MPWARVCSYSSRSPSSWYGAVATASEPALTKSQSMPNSSTVRSMPSRFSRPIVVMTSSSSGHRESPLPKPWVRLASQKPPLRPLAACPHVAASNRSTSRSASRCLASSAVQSPR